MLTVLTIAVGLAIGVILLQLSTKSFENLLLGVLVLLLIQRAVPIGAFRVLDDPVLLVLLAVTAIRHHDRVFGSRLCRTIIVGWMFLLLGGVLFSKYLWDRPVASLAGAWLGSKPFAVLLLFALVQPSFEFARKLIRIIVIAVFANVVIALFQTAGVKFPWGTATVLELRAGLSPTTGLFAHPAQYSFLMLAAFALLSSRLAQTVRIVQRFPWIRWLALAGAFLGLRIKAIPEAMSIPVGRVLDSEASRRKRSWTAVLAIAFPLLIAVGIIASQSVLAARNTGAGARRDDYVRVKLYSGAAEEARLSFPGGAGFGLYGSQPSADHYSPVFYELDFDSVWGLSPNNPNYVTDAGWATLVGETGLLGFFGLLLCVAACLREPKTKLAMGDCRWTLLLVVAIDSLASPRLFDPLAVFLVGAVFTCQVAGATRASEDTADDTADDTDLDVDADGLDPAIATEAAR